MGCFSSKISDTDKFPSNSQRREKIKVSNKTQIHKVIKFDPSELMPSERQLLVEALSSLFFVHGNASVTDYMKILRKESFDFDDVLVKEGDEGKKLYIISSGQLIATVGGD